MKKNDRNGEDNANLKKMNNWGISKTEEKTQIEDFQLLVVA